VCECAGVVSVEYVPRLPRNHLPDGFFHVTARAVDGRLLFVDDADRGVFLWLLGAVTTRYGLICRAYCLMGTHYHLILEGRSEDLSVAMHRLNGRYARRYNERHQRRGHVFAGRFSAYVIRDEEHLEDAYRYLDANPVEAGLCTTPDEWPWTWIAGRDSLRTAGTGLRPVPAGDASA
jgi:putative transposase